MKIAFEDKCRLMLGGVCLAIGLLLDFKFYDFGCCLIVLIGIPILTVVALAGFNANWRASGNAVRGLFS